MGLALVALPLRVAAVALVSRGGSFLLGLPQIFSLRTLRLGIQDLYPCFSRSQKLHYNALFPIFT